MKYQSEIIKEIVDKRGHKFPSLHYQSECVESWIEETKGSYPKLCDYEGEWLNYIVESPIGEFPYVTLSDVTEATVNNVVPYAYKSAILKGSTKYRDIDTGEVLDAFEDGRNLELVSVNMPILTTNGKNMMPINSFTPIKYSGAFINHKVCDLKLKPNTKYTFSNKFVTNGPLNMVKLVIFDCNNTQMVTLTGNNYITFTTNTNEDYWVCIYNHDAANKIIEDIMLTEGTEYVEYEPYKSNILTVNEDVTLRSNGSAYDELDLLTGKLTQRIDENGEVLSQEIVKTVDLSVVDQDGNTLTLIKPIEGTMHLSTSSDTIQPTFSGEIPVEAITQNLASFIEE